MSSLHGWQSLVVLVILYTSATHSAADNNLCQLSFCTCQKDEVVCKGSGSEDLKIGPDSLSDKAFVNLRIENFKSVTIGRGAIVPKADLDSLYLGNIGTLKFGKKIFGEKESTNFLSSFTISNVKLELDSESFENSPRCSEVLISHINAEVIPYFGFKLSADRITIENSEIGDLKEQSVYSDALHCNIINNTIGTLREKAIDASIRWFNFSLNTVDHMENRAISTGFLRGEFVRNVFKKMSGTPLKDIGPDPVCMPDPDSDPYEDYGDIVYNVVANPRLKFSHNVFKTFNITFLDFPGAKNVPLGSLTISNNKIPCECHLIKDLALIADFDHIQSSPTSDYTSGEDYGDTLFKKEFYATGLCDLDDVGAANDLSLRRFSRAWLEVTGDDNLEQLLEPLLLLPSCGEAPKQPHLLL